jgi:hypothetical protein
MVVGEKTKKKYENILLPKACAIEQEDSKKNE